MTTSENKPKVHLHTQLASSPSPRKNRGPVQFLLFEKITAHTKVVSFSSIVAPHFPFSYSAFYTPTTSSLSEPLTSTFELLILPMLLLGPHDHQFRRITSTMMAYQFISTSLRLSSALHRASARFNHPASLERHLEPSYPATPLTRQRRARPLVSVSGSSSYR